MFLVLNVTNNDNNDNNNNNNSNNNNNNNNYTACADFPTGIELADGTAPQRTTPEHNAAFCTSLSPVTLTFDL